MMPGDRTLACARQQTGGLLLLDKPVGSSSNQVLSACKRVLGIRKAGHAGTLDPFASGMLVCAFARATRVNAFLLEFDKCYQASMSLGTATTTGDPEGEVCASAKVPDLDCAAWQLLANRLTGSIEQIPPMYSALKVQGKRLYELARQGVEIERSSRTVHIAALEITAASATQVDFTVRCSKGTYIRTLAQQLAELAATVTHLTALRRTSIGPFQAEQMVSMEQLQQSDDPLSMLLPADAGLQHLPLQRLDHAQAERFRHGQALSIDTVVAPVQPAPADADAQPLLRVYGADGLLGIARQDAAGKLHPKRMF
ncbi:MAG: tRNA pseudouridine(55) synthase TruB [Gammaproteobacteria bacterium]|jgi:tRNA pseudouridine55 synthase|nr:tRNA pseudouridine(55) synthase TruB [Gammaproteobacteria bacterium]